ncbi:hypothetical protein BDV38DRAFT_258136 [Aspergillus pseudotamarii]|uniref:Uncharacterized protein n=1 Tax=Aspergillus pseudotamarii TaxID=132259 RepID=A0A5N6SFM4_ASPPS|nr:uncharacterized protein BDV38DRAFT_258136 [Aspergillus pseudotamarii]KAE8133472.1 hypothetical protein BDV38DRAFT_258136 [Aspergillus pseudotamarii]
MSLAYIVNGTMILKSYHINDQKCQTSKEVLRTEHVWYGFIATASVETANVGKFFIIRARGPLVDRRYKRENNR